MRCARCGAATTTHSMSFFNTDDLCMDCKADEKLAPGYGSARAAEAAAVQAGNLNFAGVGLSAADEQFLAARRAARPVKGA